MFTSFENILDKVSLNLRYYIQHDVKLFHLKIGETVSLFCLQAPAAFADQLFFHQCIYKMCSSVFQVLILSNTSVSFMLRINICHFCKNNQETKQPLF